MGYGLIITLTQHTSKKDGIKRWRVNCGYGNYVWFENYPLALAKYLKDASRRWWKNAYGLVRRGI